MTASKEVDELADLEARVAKAVEIITKLRTERDSARKEAADAKAALARLEDDRKSVRSRIEKLLGQIDLVSSEA